MKLRRMTWFLVSLCLAAVPFETNAGVPGSLGCVPAARPAATLLLPYFEVDLQNPAGRNTFFSVNNASPDAVVVHAVVYSNRGVPVLSFDLAVDGDGVRSFNLRDLLVGGNLPGTHLAPEDRAAYPGCTDPLAVPALDPPALAALVDRLAGRPGGDGLCSASPVEDGRVVTGFMTIDVVNDCSGPLLRHPLEEGYFAEGGQGLAANDNVLWGDVFLVDADQDFAQGFELVSIVADAERFGPQSGTGTFYPEFESNRAPLGHFYRTRYLRGGAFDGGTELLVWWAAAMGNPPDSCDPGFGYLYLEATFRNEAGEVGSTVELASRATTARFRIGEEPFAADSPFGTLDVGIGILGGGTTEPFPLVSQGWVLPIYSAQGRYSVGLNAVQLHGFCP